MTFNLGWGNAVAVRHAFLAGMPKSISFEMNDANLNYTKHEGNAKLIEITKSVL